MFHMTDFDHTKEDVSAQSASTDAPLAMHPGETIMGKFKIVDLLGSGGMGSVYRVDHLFLGRQFALKCLNKQQANDVSWRRFQNEAKAASKLDHPNLIKVHEFDLMPDGRPFILMDLVEGTTLSDLTKSTGSLPVKRVIEIMIQVAFAIQYAHDQGIIHRDLKPTNIMVTPPETEGGKEGIKLVDFGIAKLTGIDEFNQQTLTKTGEIFGSPLYMSPEQCTGTMVDHRSDLYSIGCVFYDLLTGAPPFIGENALSTMMKHQTEIPLSLKEASLGANFPPEVEQIVAKLLEKDPNRRYQTGNALALDLIPLSQSLDDPKTQQLEIQRAALSKQGQTTQFLPRESAAPAKKQTGRNIAILAGTAIVCFSLGFATNSLTRKPETETVTKPSNKEKIAPVVEHIEPFLKSNGTTRYFHFPAGMKKLGLLAFDERYERKTWLKVAIPPGRLIGFQAGEDLIANPQYWNGFGPNDFGLLDFGGVRNKGGAEVFSVIPRFTGLKFLNVGKSTFSSDELKYIDSLPALRGITFGFCERVKGQDILTLKCLPNLNFLDIIDIKNGRLVVREAANLNNLRMLVADSCDVTDDDLAVLSRNKSLKILNVACNTKVTDAGIEHLKQMKQLQVIVLRGTSITPKCVDALCEITDLKELEIVKVQWTDAQQRAFEAKLKKRKPNVKIFWDEHVREDLSVAIPEFPWKGPWTNSDAVHNEKGIANEFDAKLGGGSEK